MSEPKLLTDEALANIHARSDAKHMDYPVSWAVNDVAKLLDHIDAVKAQYLSSVRKMIDDANEVGKARIAFEEAQTKLIQSLTISEKSHGEFAEKMLAHILDLEDGTVIKQLGDEIKQLKALREKDQEAWIDVQRRVQDANDQLRWREAEIGRLNTLLLDTLEPLEAAGVLETNPDGLIMRIKTELAANANGPG